MAEDSFGPDGKRIRRKVSGRTKAEVRNKLKAVHNELDRGLHTSATYTVRQAVDDWLEGGNGADNFMFTAANLLATDAVDDSVQRRR